MRRVILILFVLGGLAFAQNSTDFFPHQVGNMWEYMDNEGFMGTIFLYQMKITRDSLDPLGNLHIFMKRRDLLPVSAWSEWEEEYVIDTLHQVWGKYYETVQVDTALLYKLNGQVGDRWIILEPPSGGADYFWGRIRNMSQQFLFGANRLIMDTYYYLSDTTDTIGLGSTEHLLADGIGLYKIGRYESDVTTILKGAVINGVVYGDTTFVNIDRSEEPLPTLKEFVLYANYPNPFNSTTRLVFRINRAQQVSFIIYDITGKEVTRLLDEKLCFPGVYTVNWDGRNLSGREVSSGVYFYVLKGNREYAVKKLILSR